MTDDATMRVLGVCGSLRRGSFNRAVLRAAIELAPEGMTIEPAEIRDIPLYDEDLRSAGLPPAVVAFREAIAAADALLFVSPEYNFSIPGVLKNAIDWASRPPDQPLAGKPTAIMGASPGLRGTVRMQPHLRQVLAGLDALLLNRPEVAIPGVRDKIDDAGRLADEETRKFVRAQLEALKVWTLRLRAGT